jgi:multiple sugar transport system substrate-binding protein
MAAMARGKPSSGATGTSAMRRALRRGLAALLLALSGCRGESDTLTVALAILPGELPAYREIVAGFERAEHERVVLVPQQYPDIRRALAAEAAAGRGTIDLAELDVYSLAPAAAHLRALEPAALDGLPASLEPAALDAGVFDGLRFLPHRITWQAMLYNHDVLGRPPATWDELLEVARAHPAKIGFKGALYEGLTCDVLPFVWSAGGDGASIADRGAIEAFRLFAALAPYVNPRSATFKEASIAEAMARGELVLHLNWPFAISLYASQRLAPEPIRAAPLPAGPAGRATVLGGGYFGIPQNAPHPERALALLRFLLSRETQAELGRRLGWFSARRDVPVSGGALLAGFAAMRDVVRSRPERPDYPSLSRAWQRSFRAVVFSGADPEATLRAAEQELARARAGGA